MDMNHTVEQLLKGEVALSQLSNHDTLFLKALGWQFASRYKFAKDKESDQSQKILALLLHIRKLVRGRLNLPDALMARYEKEQSS